jgi:hypothetical protein
MENQVINLVCAHNYKQLLSKINGYQIDLGRNYTKRDEFKNSLQPHIKDSFVLDFYKDYQVLIYKVGVLGIISIYTYSNLEPHEVIIYKGEEKYTRQIDLYEAESNIEKNLAELLWSLDKKEE